MSTRWAFSLRRDPIRRKTSSLRLNLVLATVLVVALGLVAMHPAQGARQPSIPASPTCNTYISSGITTDTTWAISGSPYCLTTEITVDADVTLTIEPGVIVYPQSTSSGLGVNGALNAVGTLAQPIMFTSFNSTPAPGDWLAIRIFAGGSAHLEYCDISYAGNGYGAGIQDMSSNFEMSHCQVHHNLVNGLYFFGNNGVTATVADSQFDHNTGAGILESPGASGVYDRGPTYTNITFSANGVDGLVISEGTLNFNRTLDGPAFNGSPIILADHALHVSTGQTLTINPGSLVQFTQTYGELFIDGGLIADGTLTQPITFTTDAASPTPDSWYRIIVTPSGTAQLSYCNLGYSSEALRIESSNVQVSHCRIHDNGGNGVYIFGSNGVTPVFTDTQIDHNGGVGILEFPGGSGVYDRGPAYTNISFSANGTDSLVISEGILNYSRTLNGQDFNGSPIILADHALYVTTGHTLTISPGSTIQFTQPYGELNIDGVLIANGTPSQRITFTANAVSPSPGSWRRIIVTASGTGQLSFCDVEYTSEGLRVETPNVQVGECRIHHSAGDGIYVFGVQVSIVNDAITDNGRGVVVNNGGQVNGTFLTLARNGTGAFLDGSATVILTNTILADNTIGVHVDGGGDGTLVRTLWDSNTTPVEGTISDRGHISGPAGFAVDGYHITLASAATHAGVSVGPSIDIDGETRPQPPGSAPDLGCDEIYSVNQIFLALVLKH
jgi:hypothetical protein